MNKFLFNFSLSIRYMIAQRKYKFVSVTSLLSFLGIAIGVATLITVLAVMNGFRSELLTKILGVNGHVQIYQINPKPLEYEKIVKKLETVTGVLFAIPTIDGRTLVLAGKRSSGAIVRGVAEEDIKKIKLVANNIIRGSLNDYSQSKGLLVGIGLARKLAVVPGDSMTLTFPEGESTPFGVVPKLLRYKVAAIFQVGISQFDNNLIYLNLEQAQEAFNMKGLVDNIEITTINPDKVGHYRQEIEKKIQQYNTNITDWRFTNVTLFAALEIERNVMFIILSLIIIIAMLNIISCMTMLVREKRAEIAILRTLGMQRKSILMLFLIAGSSIGFLGTLSGLILGILLSDNIETIRQLLSNLLQTQLFPPEIYFLQKMVAKIDQTETFFIIITSFLLSVLATVIPSLQASKVEPAQELRFH